MKMFISIYIMTIVDILATVIGIKTGWVEEANPLMGIIEHYPLAVGFALAISIGLILNLVYQLKFGWIRYAMWVVFMEKAGVLFIHANWISHAMRG